MDLLRILSLQSLQISGLGSIAAPMFGLKVDSLSPGCNFEIRIRKVAQRYSNK